MTIPRFPPDYPSAIVFPCHETNCYNPADRPAPHKDHPNWPRAFIMHTPEEPADGYPSTPHWFSQPHPDRAGSTTYFVAYNGDVYQILPEAWGAIANGLDGKPKPSWAVPGSLNWQTLSVEVEGYAADLHETMVIGGKQWNALVALVRNRCLLWKIPLDRDHIMGHYQLSVNRSDPGAGFPWEAFIAAINEEDELKSFLCWDTTAKRVMFVGPAGPVWVTQQTTANELSLTFGPMKVALSGEALKAMGAK